MANNSSLLIVAIIFAFLMYALLLATVRFPDMSSPNINVRCKYAGRVTDSGAGWGGNDGANIFTLSRDSKAIEISSHGWPRRTRLLANKRIFSAQTPNQATASLRAGAEHEEANRMRKGNISKTETLGPRGGFVPISPMVRALGPSRVAPTEPRCVIRILFWCDDTVRFNGSFLCPETGCTLLVTRSLDVRDLKKAEIVLFYHRRRKPWGELTRSRPLGQIWVFYCRESLHNCPTCLPPKSYGRVFNISMTHLRDSDIFAPYGWYTPYEKGIPANRSLDHTDWLVNKSKHVLWVASSCNHSAWNRVEFVEHLSEYTDVDAYGRCGSLTCPREETEYCRKVFTQYKFYLALENSLCQDYITEKVWKNSLGNNLVPVVIGASREEYEKALPPNSFIFAEDFNSTRELARFLDTVGGNATRYGAYFEWRGLGEVSWWKRYLTFQPDFFCHAFSKLDRNGIPVSTFGREEVARRQSIPIEKWWRTSCRTTKSPKFAEMSRLRW